MTGEGAAPTCLARIGRYQVVRPLAQGGMAELYLARRVDRAGGPAVALKVLGRARAADPEARAMFLDEARVAGLLAHPNIAAAVEVDELDGHCLLAMEYVDGADLRVLLAAAQRAGVAIPLETALSIVSAAALGLDHAHRRCAPDGAPLRLVHRDVSLSNIMVGRAGEVKVIDFGIATTAIASVHTSPGVVRGKASYMSPEQCLGDRVDARPVFTHDPSPLPQSSTDVVELAAPERAFRLVVTGTGPDRTYGCGTAPGLDRLSSLAAGLAGCRPI